MSAAEQAAYERYQKYCAQLNIPSSTLYEYLKVTSKLNPGVISWTGTK